MTPFVYYAICTLLTFMVLGGIWMMSRVQTAKAGNQLSALSMLLAIVFTLLYHNVFSAWTIYIFIAIGSIIGLRLASKVQMIQMPQLVALLNGIGGGASALVGYMSLQAMTLGILHTDSPKFAAGTSVLAIIIGLMTLVGSLVAAGKLHKLLPQKPLIYPAHSFITNVSIGIALALNIMVFLGYISVNSASLIIFTLLPIVFGWLFAIRVGGADMPITISLLNSLSGLAGAIAGMATGDLLLVAVGGVVGASGLLLTQIMCRAMNRSLMSILLGAGLNAPTPTNAAPKSAPKEIAKQEPTVVEQKESTLADKLSAARDVIIVPGYGMALSQAQHEVRALANKFTSQGAKVRYAIHPVAGRMPGHMNVLLAEADVDYEDLFEMDTINDDFKNADIVIVIGANDVLNPAAREAEGTPIYGMPVLNVDHAKQIIICNFDLSPGYAGVPNPLYTREQGVHLMLGDAKESLKKVLESFTETKEVLQTKDAKGTDLLPEILTSAREVIIVPGYGMALSQAQHEVRALANKFTSQGAKVRYAIHPVAGRMPGHMNVLLAEADVDYEDLFEMDAINDDFKNADIVIVIGANDVLNPAAREAEGTPIYGMPVLNVDHAKQIIICNFDLSPGYAGVPNPLYTREQGVHLMLGDAKESLKGLIDAFDKTKTPNQPTTSAEDALPKVLTSAREVIIVPGYGMALSQAQHEVRTLANKFTSQGAKVRYAIHPVAGRMPGHMNVLLAEADVDYEDLFEMDTINDDFKNADIVIVIGANDVLNPAAREAERTPIYGMPVLNVDHAKQIIICNFDLSPGYAGVPNPLYTREQGVHLMLGDAKESLKTLISYFS